ncbi:MAG: hypothetical protein COV44_05015 [Deltaproteobacteria bacterium CG11_big_fil_rev_8_21_14_0_20_45_16]|nr:MAG: hypothetical protein COV44_05015 [Deltaproteobacteria bacterium CG11_big_fil_rev_8_21_14_0_20_45_16]
MAARELFVFDLDGTLVHDGERGRREIPNELMRTLECLSLKADIVIATGRRYRTAKPIIESLPKMPFKILNNGIIIRNSNHEVVFKKNFDSKLAFEICKQIDGWGYLPVLVMDGDRDEMDFVIWSQKPGFSRLSIAEVVLKKAKKSAMMIHSLASLSASLHPHIIEVASIGVYEDLLELRKRLNTILPPDLRAIVVKNCGYESLSVLEIFDKKCSKWSGVEYVRSLMEPSRVIAIGDDENDYEMLKSADVSVVMDHALEHIRVLGHEVVSGPQGLVEYLRGNWLE